MSGDARAGHALNYAESWREQSTGIRHAFVNGEVARGRGVSATLCEEAPALPVDPDPVVEALKANFDRTQLRESLRRTPEERVRQLMDLQRLALELDRARATLRKVP